VDGCIVVFLLFGTKKPKLT